MVIILLILILTSSTVATAGEAYTINSSSTGVSNASAQGFVHKIVTSGSDCNATDCSKMANRVISKFQTDTYFDTTGDAFLPQRDTSSPASGFSLPRRASAFTDRELSSSDPDYYLSNSLPSNWVDKLSSSTGADPLTAPSGSSPTANLRQQDVDQKMLNYVEYMGLGDSFSVNVKSDISFATSLDIFSGTVLLDAPCDNDVSNCNTLIEQEMTSGNKNTYDEDGDDGDSNDNDGDESIAGSTMQQSFIALSGNNTTVDPTVNAGSVIKATNGAGTIVDSLAQDIEQHQNSFFYSCINCNIGADHSFSAITSRALAQSWVTDAPTFTIISSGTDATQSLLN